MKKYLIVCFRLQKICCVLFDKDWEWYLWYCHDK